MAFENDSFTQRTSFLDDNRIRFISDLLDSYACLWHVENKSSIDSVDKFIKLFLEIFGNRRNLIKFIHDNMGGNLSTRLAREITKSTILFHGSNDDVFDWLDRIEHRFKMVNRDDDNK